MRRSRLPVVAMLVMSMLVAPLPFGGDGMRTSVTRFRGLVTPTANHAERPFLWGAV